MGFVTPVEPADDSASAVWSFTVSLTVGVMLFAVLVFAMVTGWRP